MYQFTALMSEYQSVGENSAAFRRYEKLQAQKSEQYREDRGGEDADDYDDREGFASTMAPPESRETFESRETPESGSEKLSETPLKAKAGCPGMFDNERWGGFWTLNEDARCAAGALRDSDCALPGKLVVDTSQYKEIGGLDGSCGFVRSLKVAKCFPALDTYKTDPDSLLKCCTGEIEAKLCHPDYCTTNPNCLSMLTRHCKTGDNINTQVCQRIKETDKNLYNEMANNYCVANNQNGEKFKTAICRSYCSENNGQCDNLLNNVCKDKKPGGDWSSICGCNYDQNIYRTFREAIEKEWNAPPGVLTSPPVCSFPDCKLSSYKPDIDPKHPCPEVSLTNCTQSVKIDATGAVIGDITIDQSTECKRQWTKKGGESGDDEPKPKPFKPDDKKKIPVWLFPLVVILLLIIVLIATLL